jgi:hypothetical protein
LNSRIQRLDVAAISDAARRDARDHLERAAIRTIVATG